MRILTYAAIAGALAAAAPAVAQDNTAANAAAANEAAPLNAMTSMPAGPVTPGGENAALPQTAPAVSPAATTANEAGTPPIVGQKTSFPWGVLGLLGLVGLLGRKRSS